MAVMMIMLIQSKLWQSLAIVGAMFSSEDIPRGDARLKDAEDNSQGEKGCVVLADAVERYNHAPKSDCDILVRSDLVL